MYRSSHRVYPLLLLVHEETGTNPTYAQKSRSQMYRSTQRQAQGLHSQRGRFDDRRRNVRFRRNQEGQTIDVFPFRGLGQAQTLHSPTSLVLFFAGAETTTVPSYGHRRTTTGTFETCVEEERQFPYGSVSEGTQPKGKRPSEIGTFQVGLATRHPRQQTESRYYGPDQRAFNSDRI